VAGWIPLATEGKASPGSAPAAIYLHLGLDERFTGSGCWTLEPEALKRFRAALLDPRRGAALARRLAELTACGFSTSSAETLTRVPAGVDPAHPRAGLLRMKGLVVDPGDVPKRLITRPDLAGWLGDGAGGRCRGGRCRGRCRGDGAGHNRLPESGIGGPGRTQRPLEALRPLELDLQLAERGRPMAAAAAEGPPASDLGVGRVGARAVPGTERRVRSASR
jgi:Conserved hypothetical protein (DUF2461)